MSTNLADVLIHKQERWRTIAKQQFMQAVIPPRYHDWVLQNYTNSAIVPLAAPLRQKYPHCGYYGFTDAIKGLHYGYAILLNLAENLYTHAGGGCVPDMFGVLHFTNWVNELKGAINSDALRLAAHNKFILLVHGLPANKGSIWEHKELMNLIHTRFEYKCNTIWIAPDSIQNWARTMGEAAIQSYVMMDCSVVNFDRGFFRE